MAYEEYLDLVERANSTNTKYVIYTLDGIGKQRQGEQSKVFIEKSFALLLSIKKEFLRLEQEIGKKILVRDENISLLENFNNDKNQFNCCINPNFSCGDLMSFYFYNNAISVDLFVEVFNKCAKSVGNNFTYHFSKSNYETNDYTKGGKFLWVGYAQQYLNIQKDKRMFDLSFENGLEK